MNKRQAMSKLRKLLGLDAAYQVRADAPTAGERDELAARAHDLRVARDIAGESMAARRAELLRDPEYQRLRAEFTRLRQESAEALGASQRYRITAGRNAGLFFEVMARGDTWAEVLQKLENTKTP